MLLGKFNMSKVWTLRTLRWWLELWSVSLLNRESTKPFLFQFLKKYDAILIVINPQNKSVVVYLSLWDDVAAMFRGLINSCDRTQSVMVVTTVNSKIFGGLLTLNLDIVLSTVSPFIHLCQINLCPTYDLRNTLHFAGNLYLNNTSNEVLFRPQPWTH